MTTCTVTAWSPSICFIANKPGSYYEMNPGEPSAPFPTTNLKYALKSKFFFSVTYGSTNWPHHLQGLVRLLTPTCQQQQLNNSCWFFWLSVSECCTATIMLKPKKKKKKLMMKSHYCASRYTTSSADAAELLLYKFTAFVYLLKHDWIVIIVVSITNYIKSRLLWETWRWFYDWWMWCSWNYDTISICISCHMT